MPSLPLALAAALLAATPPDAGSALIEARPYRLVVPTAAKSPLALVLLLHGYNSSGAVSDGYFKLSQLAQEQGFLLATPEGTRDSGGSSFWNATDACCNRDGRAVDDVAYLAAVIDDVARHHDVDAKRVFVIGHSNGGFMAHRFACERADRVAGIVAFAGSGWKQPERCKPSQPVNVLQVHGDADASIRYGGGSPVSGAPRYPSAAESVGGWALRNGCGAKASAKVPTLDLIQPEGNETRQDDFQGCPKGGAVSLWTLEGGSHVPGLRPGWSKALVGWLLAHPR